MEEVLSAARPGMKINQLQARGRRVLDAMLYRTATAPSSTFMGSDWTTTKRNGVRRPIGQMENGMVVAVHIYCHGDESHRYYIEEIGVVRPDGIERFFTWDMREPLVN